MPMKYLPLPRLALLLAALFLPQLALAAPVQRPVFRKQIKWTGTSWFASTIVHDLGTNQRKIIGTFYDIFVWDAAGNELDRVHLQDRIYAPAVCADLDGDGIYEIVAGSGSNVVAYEWKNGALHPKAGWPASTCSAGQCPEVRGLAAGDLDGNGTIEIVATTTQTNSNGAQVFVFNPDGTLYQPPGLSFRAWPRYNTATGPGNDADANGPGNHGYGCYGLNVGIGNLDDDPQQEIVVTFDNHQINVFQHTGVSMLASPWFTNPSSQYLGNRLNWGQFIRWFDPNVERDHYHLHTGAWPNPKNEKWLQWTESPPSVADINGDGRNEVVAVANVEKGDPYDTKHHSVMVLEGSYGNGDRSARRLAGWENLPSTGYPLSRAGHSWYPPTSPPAPTIVNLVGDDRPEILFAGHDGYIYCISPTGSRLWRRDIRHGRALMYASEITVADLNQDNIPELILTTYGDPDNIKPGVAHGYLMILDRNGNVLYDLQLPQQGTNGNGKGAPAAPTVMDTDGDGTLEILVQTFGAGLFIYTVPGSAENLLLWPTARGNFLRDGRALATLAGGGGGGGPSGGRRGSIPATNLLLLHR
ncbi:MAG TPA: VCBS repeat-containing protein [Desulfobulbus sp.]|nr:VCBS repeat-containing protein [Desulfobulbus sp.]